MNETTVSLRPSRNQFSLGSIFWFSIAIALLFSYSRWLGMDTLKQAMVFATFGTLLGAALGYAFGNWQEGMFWSLLMTLLAFLATAGGRLPNIAVFYGWGLVGSFCGAASILNKPNNPMLAAILMGIASCAIMAVTISSFRFPLSGLVLFDVASAAILGAILRPFLKFLQWFEARSGQSRSLLTLWLTVSVLIGNALVPIIGGVAR